MSAAVLQTLAGAAATTLRDAIERASTDAEFDELARLIWADHYHGTLPADQAQQLSEQIQKRRGRPVAPIGGASLSTAMRLRDAIERASTDAELDNLGRDLWGVLLPGGLVSEADADRLAELIEQRRGNREPTFPGFALQEKKTPTRVSRFPKREPQRSPDKQASYERRHRLAASAALPSELAARLTIGDRAFLCIAKDEYLAKGRCELSLPEIAARAGVCRETAKRAMRKARQENLISVQERPVAGQRHLTNVITIISLPWLRVLRRGGGRVGGEHFCAPTEINIKIDKGGTDRGATTPPAVAEAAQGCPTKEAAEFARELADIAGHRHGTLPKAWREADAARLAQGWIDQGVSVATLRPITAAVMARKRSSFDPTPPHSPLYFAAEIRKFIARQAARAARDRQRWAA